MYSPRYSLCGALVYLSADLLLTNGISAINMGLHGLLIMIGDLALK